MADGQSGDDGLGIGALALDSLGLLMEQLIGDVVGIVLGQQLALLQFEAREDALAAVNLALAGGGQLGQMLLNGSSDTFLVGQTQANGAVVLLDRRLNRFNALVALRASPSLMHGTNKVFVEAAIAFVAGECQPVVAATENAAL